MQRQQILGLSTEEKNDYLMTLAEEVKGKLNWWVQNLRLTERKNLVSTSPQLVIAFDVSLRGCETFCQGQKTEGPWTALEKMDHINFVI